MYIDIITLHNELITRRQCCCCSCVEEIIMGKLFCCCFVETDIAKHGINDDAIVVWPMHTSMLIV